MGHVGGLHDDVRLDRLGAELIALDVADARGAQGGATDGADDVGLAGVGRDDPGQVAGLVLGEVERGVVRQERLRVTLAGERRVWVALRVDADRRLVHAHEVDRRIRLRGRDGVARDVEADRDDQVELLVHELLDVRLVLGGVLRDDRGRGGRVKRGRGVNGALVAVLVEALVVQGADVGDDADLERGRGGRRGRARRDRRGGRGRHGRLDRRHRSRRCGCWRNMPWQSAGV